jgi:hypothetical protein
VPAVVAVKTKEAVGQDAATKVAAERLLDEARSGLVSVSRSREEGLELLTDGSVKDRALGRPLVVAALRFADPTDIIDALRSSMLRLWVESGRVGKSVSGHCATGGMRVAYRLWTAPMAARGRFENLRSREAGDRPTSVAPAR